MTIRDLLDSGVTIQGYTEIKCVEEKKEYYHGDFAFVCDFDSNDFLDREITFIYPVMYDNDMPGICIEIAEVED